MSMVKEVLAGERRWACVQSDAIEFLRSLPDDSVDLLFTSPPYLQARTYGIDAGRDIAEWVPWMVEMVTVAAPKVKGLIAINCEGQTRNYAYQPAPFLLIADLFNRGFNLRKPVVFHRVGIPGSGGPDWLRNDWEPVVCVTREGQLPWSDNTACGGKPVPAIRGPMSNRKANGKKDGRDYVDPDRTNPGNVLHCKVGNGNLGHDIAHENEAPFPLKLAEFFVKSFCPPDGVVCDPFAGSGTTCHASFENGRRFIGCDLRESQVKLCERRLSTITPSLLTAVCHD